MKCPECGHKLSTKHYDAAYQWYECPKCEGCFTYDEVLEGGISDESDESESGGQQGDRKGAKGKKAAGGRGKKRSHAEGKNGRVQEGDAEIRAGLTRSGVVAKGKKRRTEIQEDEEAVAEYEKEILMPVKTEKVKHHRDELPSAAVIGTWTDEIQDVYAEMGVEIDEMNAQDKAIILWREIHHNQGVSAREQAVPHAVCKEHE